MLPAGSFVLAALLVVLVCGQAMAQSHSSPPARDINAVLAAHDKELLAIPGVAGVYVGTLDDRRTPCLTIMLERDTPELRRAIPQTIEGYPVIVEISGEIRAFRKS
jgi:hypothetical protein